MSKRGAVKAEDVFSCTCGAFCMPRLHNLTLVDGPNGRSLFFRCTCYKDHLVFTVGDKRVNWPFDKFWNTEDVINEINRRDADTKERAQASTRSKLETARTWAKAGIAIPLAPADFKKDDAGKTMLGCLPPRALMAIGRVLTHGAARYGRDNWHRNKSVARYYDALLRHLFAWWSGEDKDPDTGESHLAHAGCCIMFLLEMVETGHVEDDRPRMGGAP